MWIRRNVDHNLMETSEQITQSTRLSEPFEFLFKKRAHAIQSETNT